MSRKMREVKEKQPFKTPKEQDPLVRIPRSFHPASDKVLMVAQYAEEIESPSGEDIAGSAEQTAKEAVSEGYRGVQTATVKVRDGRKELSEKIRAVKDSVPDPSRPIPREPGSGQIPTEEFSEPDDLKSVVLKKTEPIRAEQKEFTPAKKARILRTKSRTVTEDPSEPVPETERPVPKESRSSLPAPEIEKPEDILVYPGRTSEAPSSFPAATHRNPEAPRSDASPIKRVRTVKHAPSYASQTTGKTVRLTERTVKTAVHTVKAARKEAKTSVKTAQKTAKAAEKTAKAAKETAVKTWQAGIRAARLAAKALEALIKAIVEAAKELGAMIVSGGWAALVALCVIGAIAVVVGSCFGLFWSNDVSTGSPMSAVISSVDHAYQSEIEKAVERFGKEIEHDEIEIEYKGDNNDGDSVTVNNWNDVLAVFAVLTSTGDDPLPLIEVTDVTEPSLREVFYAMNRVTLTYSLKEEVPEDVPKPTPDEEGNVPEPNTVTVLVVEVRQKAMTYKEAAEYFEFDETRTELLEEMMSPAYYGYYAKLIGVDVYGGTDYTQITSLLPSNSKGAEVVKAALTRLGCPYLMGAKGSTKFDCSGLVYWSIKQVDPELGDRMYTNAAGQAKYCYEKGLTVGRSELEPGDLVFWVNKKCEGCHRWNEIHHVGIYIGDGKVVEAASGKGRVLIRDLWETKNYPILMFGRPYQ